MSGLLAFAIYFYRKKFGDILVFHSGLPLSTLSEAAADDFQKQRATFQRKQQLFIYELKNNMTVVGFYVLTVGKKNDFRRLWNKPRSIKTFTPFTYSGAHARVVIKCKWNIGKRFCDKTLLNHIYLRDTTLSQRLPWRLLGTSCGKKQFDCTTPALHENGFFYLFVLFRFIFYLYFSSFRSAVTDNAENKATWPKPPTVYQSHLCQRFFTLFDRFTWTK